MRRPAHVPLSLPIALLALAGACSSGGDEGSADTVAAAPAAAPGPDADRAAAGAAGVPAGWQGRTDRDGQQLTEVKYAEAGGTLEVTTGPAHILWKAADSASGAYTARATFEQLEAPQHAEAYGIFVGGSTLDQPAQRYTYVILRGDGRWSVKAREGATARTVVDWTESAAVPKQDAGGKLRHELTVQVTADSLRVLVNGQRAGAVAKTGLATDGTVGLRVNHNLHLRVTPVVISR